AGGLRKVSQAFTPIFLPVAAAQIASGKMREAEASYGYLARWMLALLLPAVAILMLSGGSILTLFGAGFQMGQVWLAVAAVACATGAFVSLGETLLIIERPSLNLFNSAAAFAAAIALNLVLIPAFGPLGAALGMLVPYLLVGLLRGFEISAVLDWHWPWRTLLKPWLAALLPLPFGLAAHFFARDYLLPSVIYLAGYFLAWRIIGLDAGDQAVLNRLLRRRDGSPLRLAPPPPVPLVE
ncbi:MAG: polysaccharide biosynthesis C-terminal domain-containing protein, partial [Chthoniobacterales bacterium]